MFRLIHNLIVENSEAWHFPRYTRANYLGDPLNIVKILSDMEADEICIYVRGDIDCEVLSLLPKFSSSPISICGGFDSPAIASKLIGYGYDRVGLNARHGEKKIEAVVSELGASSVFMHFESYEPSLSRSLDVVASLRGSPLVSEVVVSMVDTSGTRDESIRDFSIKPDLQDTNLVWNGSDIVLDKLQRKIFSAQSISSSVIFPFEDPASGILVHAQRV